MATNGSCHDAIALALGTRDFLKDASVDCRGARQIIRGILMRKSVLTVATFVFLVIIAPRANAQQYINDPTFTCAPNCNNLVTGGWLANAASSSPSPLPSGGNQFTLSPYLDFGQF
jgi:hypothetical protein